MGGDFLGFSGHRGEITGVAFGCISRLFNSAADIGVYPPGLEKPSREPL